MVVVMLIVTAIIIRPLLAMAITMVIAVIGPATVLMMMLVLGLAAGTANECQ